MFLFCIRFLSHDKQVIPRRTWSTWSAIINRGLGHRTHTTQKYNILRQSTTSDLFLTSAMKVDKMLEDKKSKIAFCVHDSLVLDVCHKEKDLINEIIEKFSGTKFADFKVNVSLGKNFGSMKKVR